MKILEGSAVFAKFFSKIASCYFLTVLLNIQQIVKTKNIFALASTTAQQVYLTGMMVIKRSFQHVDLCWAMTMC